MEGTLDTASLLSIILVVYSIILHEIAHGYAARAFGDDTAERMGRLTLNPVPHIDPIGTIVFPLLQLMVPPHRVYLGWAKPVPVQVNRLHPRPAADIVVAVAGVFVNFCIALAMAIILGLTARALEGRLLHLVLLQVLYANVGLMVFNLLPIPPLDGSHVLKYMLPRDLREQYEQVGFYGIFILLGLSALGLLSPIVGPPIRLIVGLLLRVSDAIGGTA